MKFREAVSKSIKDRENSYKRTNLCLSLWKKLYKDHRDTFDWLINNPLTTNFMIEFGGTDIYLYCRITQKQEAYEYIEHIRQLPWLDEYKEQFTKTCARFDFNADDGNLAELVGMNYPFSFGDIHLVCWLKSGSECKLVLLKENETVIKQGIYSFECAEGASLWEG